MAQQNFSEQFIKIIESFLRGEDNENFLEDGKINEEEKELFAKLISDPQLLAAMGIGILPMIQTKINKLDSIETWTNDILEKSKSILDETGQIDAICFILHVDDNGDFYENILAISHYMESSETKDVMVETIKNMCKKYNVFASCFISEVWTVQSNDDLKPYEHPDVVANNGSLAYHPDSIECFMMIIETMSGSNHYTWEINCDENEKRYIGEKLWSDSDVTGRFTNFFTKSPIQ